jgi:protein O-GlcNAc transferase
MSAASGSIGTNRPSTEDAFASAARAQRAGQLATAVAGYRQVLALEPERVEAHHNLGLALRTLGRLDEAAASFERALVLRPSLMAAHVSLAQVLEARGDLAGAAVSLGHALALRPDHAVGHYNLGGLLGRLGRSGEAIATYQRAIALQPGFVDAHTNLANALQAQGLLEAAEAAYRGAAARSPDAPGPHMNLAMALNSQGRLDEAMAGFEQVLRLQPENADASHARLCGLNYRSDITPAALLWEHRRWAERFEPRPAEGHANDRAPGRRLRVGYVSGDFHHHPVGFFLTPVLGAHDPAEVEVFCYSNGERADAVTARLRQAAGHWREIGGLSDEAAASMIRQDSIDILIDLSGHTPSNRLSLFALRAAPVQASWLGYAATTGLAEMDYLVMDPSTAPQGADAWCGEALARLPHTRFCYGPPKDAPAPGPPPSIKHGGVTFGSFNNLIKIDPDVAALWASVLAAVPGSRLVLKWASLSDGGVRRRIGQLFGAAGVSATSLEFRDFSPHANMLAQYADIDIALDPFPFCGGLTSCEALWMGVPVVTLPQDRFASRQTLGFLRTLGLEDLAASSPGDYVAIAAALSADVARRETLRDTLRPRMAVSALCDAKAFTANLEAAYREMWRRWCAGLAPARIDVRSPEG